MSFETKRQNLGNKVAVALPGGGPAQQAGSMVSLETALSSAVGARARITTSAPTTSTFEGTVHTVDPLTNLIAINTSSASTNSQTNPSGVSTFPPGPYRILPVSQISSFQILSLPAPASSSALTQTPQLEPLNISSLQARESATIRKIRNQLARLGPRGTTKQDQGIFDGISRTYPTKWSGTNMVINENVVIEPPYTEKNVRVLPGGTEGRGGVERIRKVLNMERQKLELRGTRFNMQQSDGSATAGSLRKGG